MPAQRFFRGLLTGLAFLAVLGCRPDGSGSARAPQTDLTAEEPAKLDTSEWEVYADFDYAYSIKIPPAFERIDDYKGVQKRFRAGGDATTAAEMKISVFDPRSLDEVNFGRMQKLAPGDEIDVGNLLLTKVKNLRLEPCIASQFRSQPGENTGPTFSTTCVLEAYGITIFLETASTADAATYGPLYEAALSTFQAY